MAALIRSWIASSILQHDEQHGADLSPRLTAPVLCQLVKFTSFRTTSQPSRQIAAVVCDRTHRVAVAFDQPAADSYERSKAGEDPERLTSSLRSILRLREYSISLLPRRNPQEATAPVPRIRLIIHRWDVVTGDRHDPEYFPSIKEIGLGGTRQDREVNRVLRKWWIGDSQKSHPSPVAKAVAEKTPNMNVENTMARNASAGPSRSHRDTSARPTPATEPARIDRTKLKLVNQLVADLTTAGKALPAWLFTPASNEQREELDRIEVFGVDPFAEAEAGTFPASEDAIKPDVTSLESNGDTSHLESNGHSDRSRLSNAHSGESHLSNGHTQYPPTESPRAQLPEPVEPGPSASFESSQYESAQGQAPPTPSPSPPKVDLPAIIAQSPPPPGHTQVPAGRFQTPSDDSDEDDSIPIRHVARRTKPPPRRQIFASSPPAPRASSQPTGETDEEDLSDYEREHRKALKRPAPATASAPQAGESLGVSEESVSKSQDSGSFNLTRFPQSAPLAPSSPIASASAPQVSSSAPAAANRVLVPTTTDESMPTEKADISNPSPPEPVPHPPSPPMPRKRPRSSGATTASADADDEASLDRPSKRPAIQMEMEAVKSEMATPVKSSWEPPPGQREPSTVGRPSRSIPVSVAVQQVLPGYRPDLTTFTVPGMSRELVEVVRAKAIEEKAARDRVRRRASGRSR